MGVEVNARKEGGGSGKGGGATEERSRTGERRRGKKDWENARIGRGEEIDARKWGAKKEKRKKIIG